METKNLTDIQVNSPDNTSENELSPKQLEFALAASRLVEKFTDFANRIEFKGRKDEAQNKFVSAYINGSFPEIFEIIGERSVKTLRAWQTKYAEANNDYRALAPQYKSKKPSCITPEESKILIRLYLNPKQPLTAEVIREATNIFEAKRFPNIRSYSTYKRFLDDWTKENYADYVFYREGEKGLDDKVLPYLERDYDKIEVGDIIVMDGHVNNYEIINPLTGQPKRMITVGALEFKSQYLAGYEIALTENTLSIASALRRAILTLGKLPKIVYIDNGKAFGSKYFHKSEIENLEPLFSRLGIRTIFAKAYHAQSKPIESFWGWMAEMERALPTYVGTSIATKPPRMNRGEKLHMKLYEKAMLNTTIDIWTAHKAMAWWLDQYHHREKMDGHLKGTTPAELFNAGKGPGIDKRELIFLMMQMSINTIYRKGIHMFGTWFWNEAIFGKKLGPGDEVLIRYDILDHDSIFIYDKDGSFICEAMDVAKIHPAAGILGTEADVKALHEQLALKERLKSTIVGEARQFLQDEIYPEIQRTLKEANILGLNEEAKPEIEESETKVTRKKKRSITDRWSMPGEVKAKNIDTTPKAEGF